MKPSLKSKTTPCLSRAMRASSCNDVCNGLDGSGQHHTRLAPIAHESMNGFLLRPSLSRTTNVGRNKTTYVDQNEKLVIYNNGMGHNPLLTNCTAYYLCSTVRLWHETDHICAPPAIRFTSKMAVAPAEAGSTEGEVARHPLQRK